jgi:capsular polysaccharide export protein
MDTYMRVLFISRKSSHSKYYKKLVNSLSFDARLHIMGKPYFKSIFKFKELKETNFDCMLTNQLLRKKARHPKLFNFELMSQLYFQSIKVIEKLRFLKYIMLLEDTSPDKVIIWNGKKLPNQTIVEAAKSLSIPIMYFENGLVPNSTCLDPKGVNFSSSLPKDPDFYKSYHFTSLSKLSPIQQREHHKNKKQQHKLESLPEKFIFVPFQVPNDTQVIVHSQWIKSMEQMFVEILTAVDDLGDPNLKVVFKEHPSWPSNFKHLYEDNDRAIFANSNTCKELIQAAIATITINSTVGLETLQLREKLIVLGDACYSMAGLTLQANNLDELKDCLNKIPLWKQDMVLTSNFLQFLNDVYCIPGDRKKPTKEHFKAIENRILAVDEFSKTH